MTIKVGTLLGHYQVINQLGAGGMGEVYRAKDTRLDREVAIKVLPADFANDADRLKRFEQEARATSALNHPNILTIYDVGTHSGSPYLVAELLDGEELRGQLNSGPLPVGKAIDYAQQVAAGLSAAHEKGIVHRDLKPENLFITKDGRVKILDFGLAKLRMAKAGSGSSEIATQKQVTEPGTVMGTVGYMSPEQVRAGDVDHRSDIFSFGVILYEMLSGNRPFTGDSAVELMNAILKEEPSELSEANAKIFPALDRIVRRCLEKKPERRFQSASDLRFALEALLLSPSSSPNRIEAVQMSGTAVRQNSSREHVAWIVAGVMALLSVASGIAYFRYSAGSASTVRLSFAPSENLSIDPGVPDSVVVSPDGQKLVFAGRSADGKQQLWVRPLDSLVAQPLPQTQDARNPLWSPDSRFVGFWADGKLKKVEVTGGPVTVLCEVETLVGGSWNSTGVIVFAPGFGAALHRVSETGGQAVPLTVLDQSRQEDSHMWPSFLPDGRHFLYLARSTQRRQNEICVGSLDSRETKRLLIADSPVGFVESGWLVFVREGALMAQPFDPVRFELAGKPQSIAENLSYAADWARGLASLSANGVLVYQTSGVRNNQLEWVDRQGKRIGPVGPPGAYGRMALSPDDKQAAVTRTDPQTGSYDVWLIDLLRGIATRFTFDPNGDTNPVWSPDGNRMVFGSDRRTGIYDLFRKAVGGAGNEELLLESNRDKAVTDWSSDGRFIFFDAGDPKTKGDVWTLPLFGDHKPYQLLNSEFNESGGHLSPKGTHLAYVSDESGSTEVYAQRFISDGPEAGKLGGNKQRISTNGGSHLRFSRNGRELFYLAPDGTMMAVKINGDTFEPAIALFKNPATNARLGSRLEYEVTTDGQRFLIATMVGEQNATPVNVVLNWTAGLKK